MTFHYYKYKASIWLILAPVLILIFSCRKFVQIPAAPNTLVTSQIFADSADATAAVVGIYAEMNVGGYGYTLGNGAVSFYPALSSDELVPITGSSDENEFYSDAVSPVDNGPLESVFWESAYELIYQANACIQGLSASTGLSADLQNQLIGESKLIRAIIYFNMVNLIGPVPLETTTNYQVNETMARTSTDSVYAQITADLLDAQARLSTSYVSPGKARPNVYSATALLSKVYLYQQKWDSAEIEATKIISSGMYSLVPDPNNVFLTGSTEAIWQILSVNQGYETSEGYQLVPTATNVEPNYIINPYLLNAFEPNDLRWSAWLDSNVVNGQTYYYPYKYKLGYDGWPTGGPTEAYMVFRLGEQYLIRAEAEAQQGQLTAAITDLNIIRTRASLPNTGASGQPAVLAAIQHERQVELFCEWGNRWMDLKRWGTVASVLGAPGNEKTGMWPADNHAALYPIPFTELQYNSFLVQNPGY